MPPNVLLPTLTVAETWVGWSVLSLCLSVCYYSKRKMAWAANTKVHIVLRHTLSLRSKVKVMVRLRTGERGMGLRVDMTAHFASFTLFQRCEGAVLWWLLTAVSWCPVVHLTLSLHWPENTGSYMSLTRFYSVRYVACIILYMHVKKNKKHLFCGSFPRQPG